MDEATKLAGQDTKTIGDHVFHYGNVIQSGTVDAAKETLNPLGNAGRSTITLDKDKTKAMVDKAPGKSLSEIYAGVVTHEIGHNLGGNHGDPGSIMIQVSANERSNPNTIGNGGTGVFDYSLPDVNKHGIRAIVGRMQNTSTPDSKTYNIKDSRYLSTKENSKVTSTTSGKITLIK